MGKAEDNKQHKKSSLLSTAFELFTTKGLSNTSVSDIVQKAGMAKGTFYLYFKDKYDLREKLIVYKAEHLFEHAARYSGYESLTSFSDKIIAIVNDILCQMVKDPMLVKFLDKNLNWGVFHKTMDKPDTSEHVSYMEMFNGMMKEEDCGWDNPQIMLYTIVTLVSSTCHDVILTHTPVDIDTYKPYLYESIRSIIKLHQVSGEKNQE